MYARQFHLPSLTSGLFNAVICNIIVASANTIPAVQAICPIKLNQPVTQLAKGAYLGPESCALQ